MRIGGDAVDSVETSGNGDGRRPAEAGRRLAKPRLSVAVVAIAMGIVVALVVAIVALQRASDRPATLTPAQVASTVNSLVEQGVEAERNAPAASVVAYQTIRPSLVYISTGGTSPEAEDAASGAGVVVDAQGQILTARHVVAGAQAIEVIFADGTRTTARITAEQPEDDIAVLSADQPPSVIVPAVLGGGAQVGDEVFAVGHPLGLVGSLTAGVVSGLDRSIPVRGGPALDGLIQFDAAVNPGNSGGPLLNRAGQVVGIVTALANPADQPFFVGIGFAVPIATAGGAAGAPQQ